MRRGERRRGEPGARSPRPPHPRATAGGGGGRQPWPEEEGGREETRHVSTRPRPAHGPAASRRWRGAAALGGEPPSIGRRAALRGGPRCLLRAPSSPSGASSRTLARGKANWRPPLREALVGVSRVLEPAEGVAGSGGPVYPSSSAGSRGGRSRRGLALPALPPRRRGAAIFPRRLRDASAPAAGPDRRCAHGTARRRGGVALPPGGLQPEVQGGGYPTPARRGAGGGGRGGARGGARAARGRRRARPPPWPEGAAPGAGAGRERSALPAWGELEGIITSTLPIH